MFDHLSIGVSNLARSLSFYDLALKPLGIERAMEIPQAVEYGIGDRAQFWIGYGQKSSQDNSFRGFHLAFEAIDRPAVDAFYEAAISAGGADNGRLGLRPHYHANYYAAFVIDPDGHRIEVVCHKPE